MAAKVENREAPPRKGAVKTAKRQETKQSVDPQALADWMKSILPRATAQHNKRGVMFMTGGKVFAFTRPEGVAMKLPEARIAGLVESRDASFLVMGTRTMREWVMLRYSSPGDYLKDRKLFEEAVKFVESVEK